jgi:hypothetical protein
MSYNQSQSYVMNSIICTPSPVIKLFIAGVVFLIINHKDDMYIHIPFKSIIDDNMMKREFLFKGGGQDVLFCCFSNVLLLHIPSFFFINRTINITQSLTLLEHILHHYFIMALILLLFTSTTDELTGKICNFEIIIAAQMSFYFLWHIYHEIENNNKQTNSSHYKCTIFPNFLKLTICVLVAFFLPISIISNTTYTENCDIFYGDKMSPFNGKSKNIFKYLYIYSTFLLPDIGSILLQVIVNIYPLLFITSTVSIS